MEAYVERIASSALTLPLWSVAALWLVVFVFSNLLASRARKLTGSQSRITVPERVQPNLSTQRLATQVLVATAVFSFAHVLGGAWEAFFAGGWFLTAAAVLAMNLRNHFSLSRLAQNGAATGQIALSAEYSLVELSDGLAASAVIFLAVGVLLAQASAFGAVWLLGASSLGYRRRARAAAAA